jgi:hypothetical protein
MKGENLKNKSVLDQIMEEYNSHHKNFEKVNSVVSKMREEVQKKQKVS